MESLDIQREEHYFYFGVHGSVETCAQSAFTEEADSKVGCIKMPPAVCTIFGFPGNIITNKLYTKSLYHSVQCIQAPFLASLLLLHSPIVHDKLFGFSLAAC